MNVALVALIILWWALITYAVLGGADFGAGVWDLFAVGRLADRQHNLINHALGPVWEANPVWLIFLIVGLFNVFPSPSATFSVPFFISFTLALLAFLLPRSTFIPRYPPIPPPSNFTRLSTRSF